jgi:hypothetical protein
MTPDAPGSSHQSSWKSACEIARKIRKIICHQFPAILLSPLKSHRGKSRKCGNSAKPGRRDGSMPAYESSMRNLEKARAVGRLPRPWRSSDEARMIRRYAFFWHTSRGNKPSGRDWARQLGISHTWLQKLVRKFQTDPSEMYREQRRSGDPNFARLSRAREQTQRMREKGELRPSRASKID